MLELLNRFWKEEEGQDLVEYALIAALIALGVVAVLGDVTTKIRTVFNQVIAKMNPPS